MRLVLWFCLLWKVSKLNLHLSAAHPDRAGGIGFLGTSSHAFAPILFAQGSVLAGIIASRVLYEGKNLLSFRMQAVGFIVFFVLVILGPLVMFTPLLTRAKRSGRAAYGLLAADTSSGLRRSGSEVAPGTKVNCSAPQTFSRCQTWETATRSCAICASFPSPSRTRRYSPPQPLCLSCLWC